MRDLHGVEVDAPSLEGARLIRAGLRCVLCIALPAAAPEQALQPGQEDGQLERFRDVVIRAGGIREAVQQGVITSGVMYECVTHGVAFVLAGSIRDDGPLPDTLMDLVEAQNRYAEALEGVQMVLMLSSMLHSIGVGNMLPSWVRVVCVDINPAVVTKLSDRGSMQTVGVVTDVGMFLQHLARKLD